MKTEKDKIKYYNLEPMIHPKSVAIIGASYDPHNVGHIVLRKYIHGGFSGKLYPVNVNAKDDLLGLKVYKSILDIKQEIDLVVIATPAATVPSLINECGKANAKGVVVISSGFAEVGNTDLQKQLIENAKKYNLAVIGPNCLGVMDLRSRTDTMYLPSFKLDKPIMGNVGFISQSGAIGSVVLDLIDHEGFGLSSFISYGNADVVDESDILNYLAAAIGESYTGIPELSSIVLCAKVYVPPMLITINGLVILFLTFIISDTTAESAPGVWNKTMTAIMSTFSSFATESIAFLNLSLSASPPMSSGVVILTMLGITFLKFCFALMLSCASSNPFL